jgi:hypothetical protein
MVLRRVAVRRHLKGRFLMCVRWLAIRRMTEVWRILLGGSRASRYERSVAQQLGGIDGELLC